MRRLTRDEPAVEQMNGPLRGDQVARVVSNQRHRLIS
jgi:hypothetical protein